MQDPSSLVISQLHELLSAVGKGLEINFQPQSPMASSRGCGVNGEVLEVWQLWVWSCCGCGHCKSVPHHHLCPPAIIKPPWSAPWIEMMLGWHGRCSV